MSAVAADEPPILVCDHRSELDAHHAMRAADDQGCVGQSWHRALLHRSSTEKHARFQTPCRVIPLKTRDRRAVVLILNRHARRDLGRRADSRADHIDFEAYVSRWKTRLGLRLTIAVRGDIICLQVPRKSVPEPGGRHPDCNQPLLRRSEVHVAISGDVRAHGGSRMILVVI